MNRHPERDPAVHPHDQRHRSLLKAVSWRVTGTLDTLTQRMTSEGRAADGRRLA